MQFPCEWMGCACVKTFDPFKCLSLEKSKKHDAFAKTNKATEKKTLTLCDSGVRNLIYIVYRELLSFCNDEKKPQIQSKNDRNVIDGRPERKYDTRQNQSKISEKNQKLTSLAALVMCLPMQSSAPYGVRLFSLPLNIVYT